MNQRHDNALALLILMSGVLAAAPRAEAGPVFDETACDLPGMPNQALSHLQCGSVKVARHEAGGPPAGVLALAVVIVRGTAVNDTSTAVVFERDVVLIEPWTRANAGGKACAVATILALLPPKVVTPLLEGDRKQAILACQEGEWATRGYRMDHAVAQENLETVREAFGVDDSLDATITYEGLLDRLRVEHCPDVYHSLVASRPVPLFVW